MNLCCVGISHHTAPLEIRERLWFSADEIRSSLPKLQEQAITEAVLFSTCNRTELYVFNVDGAIPPSDLTAFLLQEKSASDVGGENLFALNGPQAVEHLFSVTSGIDSLVIGDVQILSQVKEGLSMAQEAGTAGFFMKKLFQAAFRAGKRSRTQTKIGEGAVSVAYAAVELAERIFEHFDEKSALVVGAGEMAQSTAKHLHGRAIGNLYITNRTAERSEHLAKIAGGTVVPFDEFRKKLNEVDIVVTSVSADSYVLTVDDIRTMNKHRESGPLFLIDIGVPRNIDPTAKSLENVFLYDIDSLNGLVTKNEQKRRGEIPKVKKVITHELVEFGHWYDGLHAAPTITALTRLVEHIRKEEVEKNINRFDPKDRELVEILTKRIANKILHTPIVNLKNGEDETKTERLHKISTLRRLFGIEEKKDSLNDS